MDRAVDRAGARKLLSCLTDERLRIVDADESYGAALGYARDALIGRDVLEFTHPDDRDVNRERAAALIADGTPFSITKRYICADGGLVWVTNHISLFHAGPMRRLMATVELIDGPPVEDEKRVLRVAAQRILAKRRLRTRFFEDEMFGEPAFDLLLDLFAQELAGRDTYTTSAAVASGAPLTTALRQIAMLVERGLIARDPDPTDRRRVRLRMTDPGAVQMRDYLLAAENL
jgi:PAS domain S-box-containing protein